MPPKKRSAAAATSGGESPKAKRQTRSKAAWTAKTATDGSDKEEVESAKKKTRARSKAKAKNTNNGSDELASDIPSDQLNTFQAELDDDDAQVHATAKPLTSKEKSKKTTSQAQGASASPEPELLRKVDLGTRESAANGQVASSDKRLAIPVDEGCPLSTYRVFVDPSDGMIYDASLNQTNASNNNNKFYRIQLLESRDRDYQTWTRWGRVGDHGQSKLLGDGSLALARKEFDKKFKDKSGLTWEKRLDKPKSGKYVFLEKSYEPGDETETVPQTKAGASRARSKSPAKCTLQPAVHSLMDLIFNTDYFAAAMESYNYDVKKLPLGKLSKTTISRGYQALKDLSAAIDDLETADSVEELSNMYYSFIPHNFGRGRPPVIRSKDLLKREAELLDSLSDLKEADDILKGSEDSEDVEEIHPADFRFRSLGMQEMTVVDRMTPEFAEISQYLNKTEAHHLQYQLESVFRIERQGELDRFKNSPYANIASDKRLLWHGSRTTNFGGILSQGLRIAPPEAPVSGYAFDKGLYLADMSSKSANYCYACSSGDYGLLLLCEAELGSPMLVLQSGDSNAGSIAKSKGHYSTWGQGKMAPKGWKDAKCVHPSLEGVMMPDTTDAPGETNVVGGYLQYNEYICYDVAQVRLRYLLRVRM
ncbi:hypothetical protein LTR86_003988 [Recurvomyces mirabilis]|nr:hypothetical protein LTR86_003988 [Recurvomyces mirabilis]